MSKGIYRVCLWDDKEGQSLHENLYDGKIEDLHVCESEPLVNFYESSERISSNSAMLAKDSYRYGRNTPTLIFENLKPVES